MDHAPDRADDESTLTADDDVAVLLRRPDSLRSVFQPVVDLRTGDVVGYEALTRVANWPARSPEPWFSAADRAGLAPQLEAAALGASLGVRRELRAGQFLTVNLTSAVLAHPAVADLLAAEDSLEGLVADLNDLSRVGEGGPDTAALAALRGRGLLVAVTLTEVGRTELAAVAATRPDLVKLGRELVSAVHTDPLRARLVQTAVELGSDSGAGVLAQGLEALEEVRFLQLAGVGLGQGWLLGRGRPVLMPAPDAAAAWVRASWEETVTLTRVGRLALPVARLGDPAADRDGEGTPDWVADLDDAGRLRRLVRRDGTTVAAADVLRLRASARLRAAATRMVTAGPERRPHGLLVVVDDDGRFVGLADGETLVREALAGASSALSG